MSNLDYRKWFTAVSECNYDEVQQFINNGVDVNLKDDCYYGKPPVMIATERDDENLVKLLLENGANPNIQDDFDQTAIMIASYHEEIDIMTHLINHNADINIQTQYGVNAYNMAVDGSRTKSMELLVKLRPTINETSINKARQKGKDFLDLVMHHRNKIAYDNLSDKLLSKKSKKNTPRL